VRACAQVKIKVLREDKDANGKRIDEVGEE